MRRTLIFVAAVLFLWAPSVHARPWSIVGPRPLGMGGAGVAVADDAFAVQYGHFGIGGYVLGGISAKGDLDLVNIAPVSSGVTGTNLVTQLSTGGNFNGGGSIPAGDFFFSATEKQKLVTSISAMNGWNTTTATDFVQAMDFGLAQAQAGGVTVPAGISGDITGLAQIASNAQTGGSFADNTSRLLFKGIGLLEVPFTYGVGLTENLAIGANLKYMRARVYNTPVQIFNTDLTSALEKAKNDYEDSQNFGVDVGLLYRLGGAFRFGVVGRNLNSPEFDMKKLLSDDKDHLTEEAQVRAGMAVKPLSFLTLALDVDLTKRTIQIFRRAINPNSYPGALRLTSSRY